MVLYFDRVPPEQPLRSQEEIVPLLRREVAPDECVDGEPEHPSMPTLGSNNALPLQTGKTTLFFCDAHVGL
jgi:hypothetical protein